MNTRLIQFSKKGIMTFSLILSSMVFAQQPPGKGPIQFKEFDKDKNGVITEAEFVAGHEAHRSAHGKMHDQHPGFSFFDTDNTGTITPPELIAGQVMHMQQMKKHKRGNKKPAKGMYQRPPFSEFDANSDGQVSLEEFTARYNKQLEKKPGSSMKRHQPDIPYRFERMDTDKNGVISEQEYLESPGRPKRK